MRYLLMDGLDLQSSFFLLFLNSQNFGFIWLLKESDLFGGTSSVGLSAISVGTEPAHIKIQSKKENYSLNE